MCALPFPVATCTLSRRAASSALLLALAAGLSACQQEPLSPSRTESRPWAAVPAVAAAGRPNIVVIMTDDQTMESMSVMPQTLSLIGAAGVTFEKNVVTYALCCPSRATFFTGQYPHNHGVRSNGSPDGGHAKLDHSNTLPLWLQGAGYVTGHIGKYLNGYGKVDTLEIPPGWTEWYGGIGESAYDYYGYLLNENGTVVPYGTTSEHYQSDVYTGKAVDFILRRAPDAALGVPFFLSVTYFAPHWGDPLEPGDPLLPTAVPAPRHKGRFAGEFLPSSPAFNEADISDKPASMRSRA
ncbi:MAG: sulfatase-like hydrolase/transferase, partial [Gemmatimonadales bacterium]|nr:sulfatase-like hydrolase/transferase [Gemmatimonadales bacterium]